MGLIGHIDKRDPADVVLGPSGRVRPGRPAWSGTAPDRRTSSPASTTGRSGHAAAVVIGADGIALAPARRPGPAASSSPRSRSRSTALAVLVAVEEGSVDLDQPAGPDGLDPAPPARPRVRPRPSTAACSPARAGGASTATPGSRRPPPPSRRRPSIAFATYLAEAVLEPLGMASTTLDGSPAHGRHRDRRRPRAARRRAAGAARLIDPSTHRTATSVAFPGLKGVVPGYGRQDPNDWGLGLEIRSSKHPHWTAPGNDPATFGHFGRSGCFLWVDPVARWRSPSPPTRSSRPGPIEAWPRLGQAVLDAHRPPDRVDPALRGVWSDGSPHFRGRLIRPLATSR